MAAIEHHDVNLNHVDFLLTHPFHTLNQQDKKRIKELGPHRPRNILVSQVVGKKTRNFNPDFFDRYEWLTLSVGKRSLFCFYCVLFGGESNWSKVGCRDIKHLSQTIKSHGASKQHIDNAVRYQMFGTVDIATELDSARALSVRLFNDRVQKNRHILKQIIEALIFCGTHELALRGHDESETSSNRGVFLDLLNQFARRDTTLESHLQSATVAKYTSKDIQNEILDCMFNVYKEELLKDVKNATFLSVQADEATDISNASQFVIIFRFVKDKELVERFVSFVKIEDRSAVGLTNTLCQLLQPYAAKQKLIAQTYDGAAVMSGSVAGVQTKLREHFPYAHFVHCYAHQLNLILRQACEKIILCKRFFANIAGFAIFFSQSSKRNDKLQCVVGRNIPRPSNTRWNFQSRLICSVFELKSSLQECFEQIIDEHQWDPTTRREATALLNFLEDGHFCFFLDFFNKIFVHVDILFKILQNRTSTGVSVHSALGSFQSAIQYIRDTCVLSECATSGKRRREDSDRINAAAKEACDIILCQISERFASHTVFRSFQILNVSQFSNYRSKFPSDTLQCITQNYPMLCAKKLKSELEVLYHNESFQCTECQSTLGLYRFIQNHNLVETFSEILKLLNIILTTPTTSAEAERSFSTLKRIKSFTRNSMGQDRLNALAFLSIHKEYIDSIPLFQDRIIDMFASKNRRTEFHFK